MVREHRHVANERLHDENTRARRSVRASTAGIRVAGQSWSRRFGLVMRQRISEKPAGAGVKAERVVNRTRGVLQNSRDAIGGILVARPAWRARRPGPEIIEELASNSASPSGGIPDRRTCRPLRRFAIGDRRCQAAQIIDEESFFASCPTTRPARSPRPHPSSIARFGDFAMNRVEPVRSVDDRLSSGVSARVIVRGSEIPPYSRCRT